VEGFEALRLADFEGLNHIDAAKQMNVSRQTFGRILSTARKTVAEAIILGHALRIEGGNYLLQDKDNKSGLNSDKKKTGHPKEESRMSKIAISSEGPTLDEKVDPRFGRAGGFIIIDPETMEFEYKDNGAAQTSGRGAGIQAAELVSRAGAGVVLTGYVGPKAFDALAAAGIKVGQDCEGLTVREAIDRFVTGRIQIADKPNR
jgi:predicted Fe-Mo cluster-binding NifX family protein